MTYEFLNGKSVCVGCGADHGVRCKCYFDEILKYPIGMAAMTIRGLHYQKLNKFEKRIVAGIWNKIKIREKPKRNREFPMLKTNSFEVYKTWVILGDEGMEML